MARWQPQRIPPLNFLDVHRVPVYTNYLFLWLKPTNTFAITNAYQLGQARLKYSSSHVKKDASLKTWENLKNNWVEVSDFLLLHKNPTWTSTVWNIKNNFHFHTLTHLIKHQENSNNIDKGCLLNKFPQS